MRTNKRSLAHNSWVRVLLSRFLRTGLTGLDLGLSALNPGSPMATVTVACGGLWRAGGLEAYTRLVSSESGAPVSVLACQRVEL